MPDKFDPLSSTRRGFLATTGSVKMKLRRRRARRQRFHNRGHHWATPGSRRKIPIGVFDPFPDLDQLGRSMPAWAEAAEIGTGGYLISIASERSA
jgi:hypothetical protein